MEFKVKKDFLPIFLVNIVLVFIFACSVFFFANSVGWLIIVIVVDLAVLSLYNACVIFTRCSVSDNILNFRVGLFKYNIPLDKITKVTKAHNSHVSLALSLDRIRILIKEEDNKQKVYYISVEDSEKLIALIKPDKQQDAVSSTVLKNEQEKLENEKIENEEKIEPATNKQVRATKASTSGAKSTTAKSSTKAKTTATKKSTTSTTKKTTNNKTTK